MFWEAPIPAPPLRVAGMSEQKELWDTAYLQRKSDISISAEREKKNDRGFHRSIINQKHHKFSNLSTEDGA